MLYKIAHDNGHRKEINGRGPLALLVRLLGHLVATAEFDPNGTVLHLSPGKQAATLDGPPKLAPKR